ncbi:MAG: AIM24 family protein [Deltaproteobacteria bacterium]|nr:AIM24 family protein [Deltaproteobacteria bacterium]
MTDALTALKQLETEELKDYVDGISVDGTIAQFVTLQLKRDQVIWASRGSLMSYNDKVDWQLKVPGGVGKAVSRMMSGEGIALTWIKARGPGGEVVLTNNAPGRLLTWDLDRGGIVCTPGAFVAALGDVNIDVTMARKAGAAFFGGAGLFLQKLSGTGIAIVHGAGDFHIRELEPEETILVSTGNLAAFSEGIDYDIRGVGGCRKMFFGGEGMFMTALTGPGWVMMQSLKKMPIQARTQ